jgi:hypothetical protein
MKVFAHRKNRNNEQLCIYRYKYTCTAPFGILEPQPKTAEERSVLIMSQMFVLVDEVANEPGTDHVESTRVKANPTVEVFSLEVSPDDPASLQEMSETAEVIAGELDEAPSRDQEEAKVQEPEDFANYSTRELMDLCDSLGIKTRKNATRASLVEKLTAAAKA